MTARGRIIRDYALILSGVLLSSVAANNIYDPARLITGGVSGIAITLHSLIGLPLWVTNLAFNLPLFIAGYVVKGWKFLSRTVFATLAMTVLLALLPSFSLVPSEDLFLASVFGGILMGLGSGLVLVGMATTGGTELLASVLHEKVFRSYSIPSLMQIIDWIIVMIGVGVFGLSRALYAVVSVYAMTKCCDYIVDGLHFGKALFIISPAYEKIAARILEEMDRGVTSLSARGMYSGTDTQMIFCVVSRREITRVKDIVLECDPHAFTIITDVREVLGEGFSEEKR